MHIAYIRSATMHDNGRDLAMLAKTIKTKIRKKRNVFKILKIQPLTFSLLIIAFLKKLWYPDFINKNTVNLNLSIFTIYECLSSCVRFHAVDKSSATILGYTTL